MTEETPYPVKGVDVSSYQLEIDWQGLEEEGYSFAFIKATEGSSLVDERFEYNWEEASSTGIEDRGIPLSQSRYERQEPGGKLYRGLSTRNGACCLLW